MTSPRTRRPRGLTLPELLVTLTIIGLVGTAVAKLMTAQVRFWTRTREAGAVQRNLRTGLGLLPQDLRAASRRLGDFRLLTDSSIEMNATIGASMVCTRVSDFVVDLPPRNLVANTLTSWFVRPEPGDVAWFYDQGTGPANAQWVAREVASLDSTTAVTCEGAPYTHPFDDRPAIKPRWRLTVRPEVGAAVPGLTAAVIAGSPVRFTRPVVYSLFLPPGATRWYLGYRERVNGVWSDAAPVAGPFQAYDAAGSGTSGIAFRYYDSTGVQLAAPAATNRVDRVDLVMRATTRLRAGSPPSQVRDSVAVRVAVRNRW